MVQYNCQKSYAAMAYFLRNPKVQECDVIAVQEPWRNRSMTAGTHNPVGSQFYLFVPQHKSFRVALYVTKKIPREDIDIRAWSPDVITAIIEHDREGMRKKLVIHNVYNSESIGASSSKAAELV